MPGTVKINPAVMADKRDAMAVAVNEALRIAMEDFRFTPEFEVTPEQEKFFRGTAYADDPDALKKTIVARTATFDTSISPTEEQKSETLRLLSLLGEALGPRHKDYRLVTGMAELLGANNNTGSAPAQTPAQSEGTAQDDMLGGDVTLSPSVMGQVFADAPIVPVAERALPKKSWVTAARDMLIKTEKFRDTAYPDPDLASGKWAVAYGNQFHIGQKVPVKKGDIVSRDKAEAYLADAMQYNVRKLSASVGPERWDVLTGGQKAALTSWAYNVGETNARGSDLARRIRRGENAARVIREELPKWNDKGRAAERRAAEVAMAESAEYE